MKLTVVCILICIMALGIVAQTKQDESVLEKPVTLKLENEEFSQFSNFLTRVLKVPLGFEESLLDSGHDDYGFEPNLPFIRAVKDSEGRVTHLTGVERVPRNRGHLISIDAKEVKLSEVLDDVVRQMPNYKWSFENGVVRIVPAKGRNPILEELLALPIADASVEKGTIICDIRNLVLRLPVISSFLESKKLGLKTNYFAGNCNRPISDGFAIESATLEQLLNEIAKKKGGAWAVRYAKTTDETGYDPKTIDIVL